jgi:predicted outer membrane protein
MNRYLLAGAAVLFVALAPVANAADENVLPDWTNVIDVQASVPSSLSTPGTNIAKPQSVSDSLYDGHQNDAGVLPGPIS